MTITFLDKNVQNRQDLASLVAQGSQQIVYTYPEKKTIIIVGFRHRRETITRITKKSKKRFDWSRDYIEVIFQYRSDMNIMTNWEVLMLSSQKNQVASLVYEKSAVNDILRSIESYSVVFKDTYKLPYVQEKNTV